MTSEASTPDPGDGIAAALLTWVNSPDWTQSQEFLREHRDLIGETGITELYRQAAGQPRAVQVLMIDDHAWLLRLCQERGITDGYAHYQAVVESSRAAGTLADQAELSYTLTGDQDALTEALRLRREIVALVQDSSRSRRRAAQLDRGRMLLRSYQRGAGSGDLDAAIGAVAEALQIPGVVARTRAPIAILLARSLRMRYEERGRSDDLEECLHVLDSTLEAIPEDSSHLPDLLGALGEALRLRHRRTGERADLDRAVECFESAERWVAELIRRHPARLGDLGTGLIDRFQLTGEAADLDRSISVFEAALAGCPSGSPDRPAHLVNLGNALLMRYGQTSRELDLNGGVELLARADDELPATSPLRFAVHQGLAIGLGTQHDRTNEPKTLQHAIAHAERTVALSPPHATASALAQLGQLLVNRAERAVESTERGTADLGRAVDSFERALALTPPTSPGHAVRLMDMALGLATRYLRTGAPVDLERAIDLLRTAARQQRGINEPGAHLDLGNVLWLRYVRSRRLDDLDQAVAELRQASDGMPAASADRPGCMNSLAVMLAERFDRTGHLSDLTECVAALRSALASAPPDGPDHQVIASNLGNGLRIQAITCADSTLREEGIAVLRSALRDAERSGTARAAAAYNLAAALLSRVGMPPPLAEVEEAADLMRSAVELAGPQSVDAPRYLAGSGRAWQTRFRRTGQLDDARRGLAALQQASRSAVDVDLRLALEVSRDWARWVERAGERAAAAPAYRLALTAAHRLIREQALDEHKRSWLHSTAGLHADAAACLCTEPDGRNEAVVAAESGRALLLAEELELRRVDLHRLALEHPVLADRYRDAVGRLRMISGGAAARPSLLPPA